MCYFKLKLSFEEDNENDWPPLGIKIIHLHLFLSWLQSVHNKTDEFVGQTVCFHDNVERTYENFIMLINVAFIIAKATQTFNLVFQLLDISFTVLTISSSNKVVKQRTITLARQRNLTASRTKSAIRQMQNRACTLLAFKTRWDYRKSADDSTFFFGKAQKRHYEAKPCQLANIYRLTLNATGLDDVLSRGISVFSYCSKKK